MSHSDSIENEGAITTIPPARQLPKLRHIWDRMPHVLRRFIVRITASERLRIWLLDLLRIRDKDAFFPLSNGGPIAIDISLQYLKDHGIQGDYFEFGLFRGFTLWHAQRAAKQRNISRMRFFGFDSFQGLPAIEGNDREAGLFISGDYRCSRSTVERMLSEHGFDWQQGILVEGFFEQVLTDSLKETHSMRRAALVMVDCDLYQSTAPVLSFIADLLQDGTIILFDDWYCFGEESDQGEPRAFREFLDVHSEWRAERYITFPTYGQAFIIRAVDL